MDGWALYLLWENEPIHLSVEGQVSVFETGHTHIAVYWFIGQFIGHIAVSPGVTTPTVIIIDMALSLKPIHFASSSK